MIKKLMVWIYQKVADYYFYKWIETKNPDNLDNYHKWIDKKWDA